MHCNVFRIPEETFFSKAIISGSKGKKNEFRWDPYYGEKETITGKASKYGDNIINNTNLLLDHHAGYVPMGRAAIVQQIKDKYGSLEEAFFHPRIAMAVSDAVEELWAFWTGGVHDPSYGYDVVVGDTGNYTGSSWISSTIKGERDEVKYTRSANNENGRVASLLSKQGECDFITIVDGITEITIEEDGSTSKIEYPGLN